MDNNVCIHRKQDKYKSFTFCVKCGVLIYENVRSIKPIYYNYKLEVSPIKIFFNMKYQLHPKKALINNGYIIKRLSIIKNLQYITSKLKYRRQTFFLALSYLDLIFSNCTFTHDFSPELIGLMSLIIAAKYNENDPIIPYSNDLQTLYPRVFFMQEDIKRSEIFVLQLLNYELNHPTAYHFVNHFALNGFIFSDEVVICYTSSKINEIDDRISARDGGPKYSSHLSTSTSMTHREAFSQKNLQKIYGLVKEILVIIVNDPQICEYSNIDLACACIALARSLYRLKVKWPLSLEKIYDIKFDEFKDCYNYVKNIYCQMTVKKNETALFKLKQNSSKEKEAIKTIEIHTAIHGSTQKITNLSNNKSTDDQPKTNTTSKEKVTYVKKVIKDKISKFDLSDTKIYINNNIEKGEQLYRVKRPLNINLGLNKNDKCVSYQKDDATEENNYKNNKIREIKKSLINNYSKIQKEMNVSELVGYVNPVRKNNANNYSIHNNSFLKSQDKTRNDNKSKNSKSREASTSNVKINSFEYNYKDNSHLGKLDNSAHKYSNQKNNSYIKKEENKSSNRSNIVEKGEVPIYSNINNVSRKGSINLSGIPILRRLTNKKTMNMEMKSICKIDTNYKKMANMNFSISGLND